LSWRRSAAGRLIRCPCQWKAQDGLIYIYIFIYKYTHMSIPNKKARIGGAAPPPDSWSHVMHVTEVRHLVGKVTERGERGGQ